MLWNIGWQDTTTLATKPLKRRRFHRRRGSFARHRFLVSNKIQYVINCAAASVPCSWERLGVQYLTFYWRGSSDCDLSEANVERMLEFIDNAMNSAESVLIHSVDGCSRACAITAIYFMYKYVWGIDKTMLFIRHQRPDMMPQPTVAKQLDEVNQRLLYKYPLSATSHDQTDLKYIVGATESRRTTRWQ